LVCASPQSEQGLDDDPPLVNIVSRSRRRWFQARMLSLSAIVSPASTPCAAG
jgi:hypothetical protein